VGGGGGVSENRRPPKEEPRTCPKGIVVRRRYVEDQEAVVRAIRVLLDRGVSRSGGRGERGGA
jgi:hypothetical protein